MNQGLFESLTGKFSDGMPIEHVSGLARRIKSIQDHLNRMFNTRQGSFSRVNNYGLPDVSDIYRRLPGGAEELAGAIKESIERHEPRLENVEVKLLDGGYGKERLGFALYGKMRGTGEPVGFRSFFSSTGKGSVSAWTMPEH